jgi:hypothetical protein
VARAGLCRGRCRGVAEIAPAMGSAGAGEVHGWGKNSPDAWGHQVRVTSERTRGSGGACLARYTGKVFRNLNTFSIQRRLEDKSK